MLKFWYFDGGWDWWNGWMQCWQHFLTHSLWWSTTHIQHTAGIEKPSSSSFHIVRWCKSLRRFLEILPMSSTVGPCNPSLTRHDSHPSPELAFCFHRQIVRWTWEPARSSRRRKTSKWTKAEVLCVSMTSWAGLLGFHGNLNCPRRPDGQEASVFGCLLRS